MKTGNFYGGRSIVIFSIMGLIISAIFMSGCAPMLTVARQKPAEINLSMYKKIAIGNITGKNAEAISDKLTQALFESERFEVLDRQNIERIMKEQNLSVSESFDPSAAVQIGKMIGSAAMIFGRVARRDYKETKTTSKATCYKGDVKYECTSYNKKGTWNMEIALKVTDVTTGKIIAPKNLKYSYDNSVSSTEGWPAINWDVESDFSEIEDILIKQFMKVIAPYTINVQVKLFQSKDIPELEKGVNYAKRGEWADAIEQFTVSVNKADNDPEIKAKLRAQSHYNLGIAYGYSGQYDKAFKELKKASDIAYDKLYDEEMAKIKQFKKDDEKLKKQQVGPPVSLLPWQNPYIIVLDVG